MKKELLDLYKDYLEAVDVYVENTSIFTETVYFRDSLVEFMHWLEKGFIGDLK